MTQPQIKIRLMEKRDFDAVVRIDERVIRQRRSDYYENRFEQLFDSGEYIPTSLVAENEKGMVVGFIMGELYIGEFGISNEGATVDTLGVDPDFRKLGIGKRLMEEFIDHLKQLGVKTIHTLVEKSDKALINYFKNNHFNPSLTVVSLERMI